MVRDAFLDDLGRLDLSGLRGPGIATAVILATLVCKHIVVLVSTVWYVRAHTRSKKRC